MFGEVEQAIPFARHDSPEVPRVSDSKLQPVNLMIQLRRSYGFASAFIEAPVLGKPVQIVCGLTFAHLRFAPPPRVKAEKETDADHNGQSCQQLQRGQPGLELPEPPEPPELAEPEEGHMPLAACSAFAQHLLSICSAWSSWLFYLFSFWRFLDLCLDCEGLPFAGACRAGEWPKVVDSFELCHDEAEGTPQALRKHSARFRAAYFLDAFWIRLRSLHRHVSFKLQIILRSKMSEESLHPRRSLCTRGRFLAWIFRFCGIKVSWLHEKRVSAWS